MTHTLQTIQDQLSQLSLTHRKVAEFVLEHPNDAAFLNLDETARLAGVSTASVIRFARQLGFGGYREFQRQMQREVKVRASTQGAPEKFSQAYKDIPRDQLTLRTIQNDIEAIRRTMDNLPEASLRQAVHMLSQADRVFVAGMRESYALAHYAFTRLLALRPNVSLFTVDYGEMVEQLFAVGKNDVCLYFLFNRYTGRSVDVLRQLHEMETEIVLVTDEDWGELSGLAQLVLPCYVQGVSLKNTSAAPICLINCLANALAAADYDRSMENLSRAAELQKKTRVLW